jgi:hypothetical protein
LFSKETAALNVTAVIFWMHNKELKCTVRANCNVQTDEAVGAYNVHSRLNSEIVLNVHKNMVLAL